MNETLKFICIVTLIAIITLLISNIELHHIKGKAIYSGPLPKTYDILTTRQTGLHEPVYIFNSKNIKFRELPKHPGFNINHYIKTEITEHIASKLNSKLIAFKNAFMRVPKSTMPIHTLYDSISKGEQIVMAADPATFDDNKLRIAYSKNDNIEFFASGDRFYITRAS